MNNMNEPHGRMPSQGSQIQRHVLFCTPPFMALQKGGINPHSLSKLFLILQLLCFSDPLCISLFSFYSIETIYVSVAP